LLGNLPAGRQGWNLVIGTCSARAELVHRPNFTRPNSFLIFRAHRAGLHHGDGIVRNPLLNSLRTFYHSQNPLGREAVLFHLVDGMLRPLVFLGILRNLELHKNRLCNNYTSVLPGFPIVLWTSKPLQCESTPKYDCKLWLNDSSEINSSRRRNLFSLIFLNILLLVSVRKIR